MRPDVLVIMELEALLAADGAAGVVQLYDISASNAADVYNIAQAIKNKASPATVNNLIDIARDSAKALIARLEPSFHRDYANNGSADEHVLKMANLLVRNRHTIDVADVISREYNEQNGSEKSDKTTSSTNLINQISSGVVGKIATEAISKIKSSYQATGVGVGDLEPPPNAIISGKDIIAEASNFGKSSIDTTSSVSLINKSASTTQQASATGRSLKIIRKIAEAPEKIPTPLVNGRLYEAEPKTVVQQVVGAARNFRDSIFGKPTTPELGNGSGKSLFDQGYEREDILDVNNPVSNDGVFRLVEGSGGDPGVKARELALGYANTVDRNKTNLRITNKLLDTENLPLYESAAAFTPFTGAPLYAASLGVFLGTAAINYRALEYAQSSRGGDVNAKPVGLSEYLKDIYDDYQQNERAGDTAAAEVGFFQGLKDFFTMGTGPTNDEMISAGRQGDRSIKGPTNREPQTLNGNTGVSVPRSYIGQASNMWRMQSPIPSGEETNNMPERDRPIKVTPLTEAQTGVNNKVKEDAMDSFFYKTSISQPRSNINTGTSLRGTSNVNAAGPGNGTTTGNNDTDANNNDDGSLVGRFTKAVKNTAEDIGFGGGVGGAIILVGGSYILYKIVGRGTKRKRR